MNAKFCGAFSQCDRLPNTTATSVPKATATTYSFRLTSGEDTYTGTATAQLNAGEYVVATGLKLTK